MYKTLVTCGKSGANYVFVIPVAAELNLKKAAEAVGEKSIAMLKSKDLLGLTGYIHGGCSPVGMKKLYPTVLDSSAQEQPLIFVSAGKIGLQLGVNPQDLAGLVRGKFASVTSEL